MKVPCFNLRTTTLFFLILIQSVSGLSFAASSFTEDQAINPPENLQIIPVEQASYATPMSAATALYSSMACGNYEAWLASWEPKEKKLRLERDQKMGRTPSFWTQTWKKSFEKEKLRFTRKAKYQEYYLIGYEMVDSSGKVTVKSAAAFKEITKGNWRATLDLSSDPVYQNFP